MMLAGVPPLLAPKSSSGGLRSSTTTSVAVTASAFPLRR